MRSFNSKQPLALLHLDIWGPSPVASLSNYRYYFSIVDDFSRYTWLFPLTHKSDVVSVFATFKLQIENQLSSRIEAIHTIKTVQTDGGGKFTSNAFRLFLSKNGIKHQLTCPYTPQQNGVMEHKHRHIEQMGLCLLAYSNLPMKILVGILLYGRLLDQSSTHETA